MREYQKGEFCQDKDCMFLPILMSGNKKMCESKCRFTAYQLHNWLKDNGFKIVKEVKNAKET